MIKQSQYKRPVERSEEDIHFESGVSGYGVSLMMTSRELMDEGAVKSLAEDIMSAVTAHSIRRGARSIAHIQADLHTDGGTIRTHTIGPNHGIYTVGHLTSLSNKIHMVLNSVIQGIDEEQVRQAAQDGINEAVAAFHLDIAREREHTYYNPHQSPSEGSLLVNKNLRVVEANHRASQVFNTHPNDLVGQNCWTLLAAISHETLYRAIRTLYMEQRWSGEFVGRRSDGKTFPVKAQMNWVEFDQKEYIQILIRDVTEQRSLEETLRKEKRRLRELNITLRNIMVAIEDEKKHSEKSIAQKIRTLILPTLEKAKNEPSDQLRNAYLDIIAGQLTAISGGVTHEYESRFFKLTRTEMKICQLIQSGYTSKEIASILNIAFDTVQTHRRNIRRKLGLQGRDVNLFSFLSSR